MIIKEKLNAILLILFVLFSFIFFYMNYKESFSLGGQSRIQRLRQKGRALTKKGRAKTVQNARQKLVQANRKANRTIFGDSSSLKPSEIKSLAKTLSSNRNIEDMRKQKKKLEKGNSNFKKKISRLSSQVMAATRQSKESDTIKKFKESEAKREAKNANRIKKISDLDSQIARRETERQLILNDQRSNTGVTEQTLINTLTPERSLVKRTEAKKEAKKQELIGRYEKSQRKLLSNGEQLSAKKLEVREQTLNSKKTANIAISGKAKVNTEQKKLDGEKEKLEGLKVGKIILQSREGVSKAELNRVDRDIAEQEQIIENQKERLRGMTVATVQAISDFQALKEKQKKSLESLQTSANQMRRSHSNMNQLGDNLNNINNDLSSENEARLSAGETETLKRLREIHSRNQASKASIVPRR